MRNLSFVLFAPSFLFHPRKPKTINQSRRLKLNTVSRIDRPNSDHSLSNIYIANPNATPALPKMPIVVHRDFSSAPLLAVRDRLVDPLSLFLFALAAILGVLSSLFLNHKSSQPLYFTTTQEDDAESDLLEDNNQLQAPNAREHQNRDNVTLPTAARATAAENSVWLNMSLSTLWRLFRRSTNGLVREILQPVLDDMEYPDFMQAAKISSLTLGKSPCLVRNIQRVPSRALNEIQYEFDLRLIGDKHGRINMDVFVPIPGVKRNLRIPISVSSLDIDAKVWLCLKVVPYKPWIQYAQWALVSMPVVSLQISIANLLPVTTIPILSNVLRKIFTRDVPYEFLFPKTQMIDFMDASETDMDLELSLLESQGLDASLQEMSEEELRSKDPFLCSLFDEIDANGNGVLSPHEISQGLIEWGYASQADHRSITNLLDTSNDGVVSLGEFISVWGDLRNIFVPHRFRGIVSGVLVSAEDLRQPLLGRTDPYVIFSVESQTFISKNNRATSRAGKEKGTAFWNESWELYIEQPRSAVLRVEVREGSRFTFYMGDFNPLERQLSLSGALTREQSDGVVNGKGKGTLIGSFSFPISSLKSTAEAISLDLAPDGGHIRLDIQFSMFVDPTLA